MLCLKHRGAGKVLLRLSSLPSSLQHLTCKKVMLLGPGHSSRQANTSSSNSSMGPAAGSSGSGVADAAVNGISRRKQQQRRAGGLTVDVQSRSLQVITPCPPETPSDTGIHSSSSSGSSSSGSSSSSSNDVAAEGGERGSGESSAAAAGAARVEAGDAAALEGISILPKLQSLVLRSCLVAEGVPAAIAAACGRHLIQLSITGDSSHSEVYQAWLTQLPLLQGIQVLEIWVPDARVGRTGTPLQLVEQLSCLPKLVHLHVNSMGGTGELLALGKLKGLKTLAVDYTGPPRLPKHVLEALTEALPCCKVQLWETLSFNGGRGGVGGEHMGDGWGEEEERKGGVWGVMATVGKWGLGLVATAALGYWTGRLCAGKLGKQKR